jgi:RNA-binding protein
MEAEKPTVLIGKNGVTPEAVEEISKQLDKRGMVKVKLLKSALINKKAKDLAEKIAQQKEATLIDVRGHTFVLYKGQKRKNRKSLYKTPS